MEKRTIDKKELKSYLGKPVWYQCLTDINDFGWAFIHPDTVKLQPGGYPLGYCKLIKPNPNAKDFYSWDAVRLFKRPTFHGLCRYCKHWLGREKLIRCALQEEGKVPACTIEKKYRDFEPTPYFEQKGYSANTFIRQIELSGYSVKKKEKQSC